MKSPNVEEISKYIVQSKSLNNYLTQVVNTIYCKTFPDFYITLEGKEYQSPYKDLKKYLELVSLENMDKTFSYFYIEVRETIIDYILQIYNKCNGMRYFMSTTQKDDIAKENNELFIAVINKLFEDTFLEKISQVNASVNPENRIDFDKFKSELNSRLDKYTSHKFLDTITSSEEYTNINEPVSLRVVPLGIYEDTNNISVIMIRRLKLEKILLDTYDKNCKEKTFTKEHLYQIYENDNFFSYCQEVRALIREEIKEPNNFRELTSYIKNMFDKPEMPIPLAEKGTFIKDGNDLEPFIDMLAIFILNRKLLGVLQNNLSDNKKIASALNFYIICVESDIYRKY